VIRFDLHLLKKLPLFKHILEFSLTVLEILYWNFSFHSKLLYVIVAAEDKFILVQKSDADKAKKS